MADDLASLHIPTPPANLRTADEKARWFLTLTDEDRQKVRDFVDGRIGGASGDDQPDNKKVALPGGMIMPGPLNDTGVMRALLQVVVDRAGDYQKSLRADVTKMNGMAEGPVKEQYKADLISRYGKDAFGALSTDILQDASPAEKEQLSDPMAQLKAINDQMLATGSNTDPDAQFIGGSEWLDAEVAGGSLLPGGTGKQVYDAFKTLAATNPARLAQIQALAAQGGVYPSGYTPTFGVLSDVDRDAMGKLINLAADTGQDITAMLQTRAQVGQSASVQQAQAEFRASAVTRIERKDPGELALLARKVATATGGSVPPGFEKQFAAWYNSEFVGRQKAAAKQENAARWDAVQAKYGLGKYAPQQVTADPQIGQLAAATDRYHGEQQLDTLKGWLGVPAAPVTPTLPLQAPAPLAQQPVFVDGQWVIPGQEQARLVSAVGNGVQVAGVNGATGGPADPTVMPGGTVIETTAMPDPQAAAEMMFRAQHPAQAGANDIVTNYLDVLNHLVGG